MESVGSTVREVRSKEELEGLLGGAAPAILHFWEAWCEASTQMDRVFSLLAADFPHALFLRVEAEEQPEISEAYKVSAVPYFVFFKDGKTVDTLEGANPSSLAEKVAKVAGSAGHVELAAPASLKMAAGAEVVAVVKTSSEENRTSKNGSQCTGLDDSLKKRMQDLVTSHLVFLFMKGSSEQPKCGFSQKVVDILKDEGIQFGSFDILTDNEVREGMKKFSNWPTFPQLFCKGELLGGCDIVTAMHESGELKEVFREHGIVATFEEAKTKVQGSDLSAALITKIKNLIDSNPVMLFMKGKPEEPKCGFSRKAVEILCQQKVQFNSFDILSDDEVRQGLKAFSNWSSYPQLYIKGELIGGSDFMLEMQKSGELKKSLAEKGIVLKETLDERLKNLTSISSIMLFMKGTPDAPRCGFSSKVVDALRKQGINFRHFDILTDDEVRQGLKTFSNWPTFPQLYYKGELIGGCDIVLELQKSGELKSTLSE